MKSIKIINKRNIIIIEKSKGNDISKGSRLFCGCCGRTMGRVSQKLSFPFKSLDLHNVVVDKSYEVLRMGLRHKTCGHVMFQKDEYKFITAENYLKMVAKEKVLAN